MCDIAISIAASSDSRWNNEKDKKENKKLDTGVLENEGDTCKRIISRNGEKVGKTAI